MAQKNQPIYGQNYKGNAHIKNAFETNARHKNIILKYGSAEIVKEKNI